MLLGCLERNSNPSNLIYMETLIHSASIYTTLRNLVLHFAILRHNTPLHATLYYSTSLCTSLRHTTLFYATRNYSTPFGTTLSHSTPLQATLYYSTSPCTTLRHTKLLCAIWHYSKRHFVQLYATIRHSETTLCHYTPPYATLYYCTRLATLCDSLRHYATPYDTMRHHAIFFDLAVRSNQNFCDHTAAANLFNVFNTSFKDLFTR